MNEPDETTPQEKARQKLEDACSVMGRNLAGQMPPGVGFALLMFDFGPKGSFVYCANANRLEFLRMLDEAREKLRNHTQ